jgi:hypothetical protein
MADALRDLRPQKGVLSVFEISDPTDTQLVERAVVAIAALGRDRVADVAFRLFDAEAVVALDVQIDSTPGNTGDREINVLHRNLINLTAEKLARLAAVMAHSNYAGEILSDKFKRILRTEVSEGRLARDKVHKKLQEASGLTQPT